MLEKVITTERGFELINFQDAYGIVCSLQQSSLAGYRLPGATAVWLGCGQNRMHLKRGQVQELITVLQAWLDTGSFVKEEKETIK